MKKLHLVLLLAGVLAIGSAFTSTNVHRDPCEDPEKLVHRTAKDGDIPATIPGTCEGGGQCLFADTDGNGTGDVYCDVPGTFVRSTSN